MSTAPTFTITTWNLQGREPTDTTAIVDVLRAAGTDIAVLQEVQRRQARRIADGLGAAHRWAFKHWTVRYPAEGLAVVSRLPMHHTHRWRISARKPLWSFRRRIAMRAVVTVGGGEITIVNVHLGSDAGAAERRQQVGAVLERVDAGHPTIVAGDFNVIAPDPVLDDLAAAGLHDLYAECGPTNWHGRDRTKPPTQRLDYVVGSSSLHAAAKQIPGYDDAGFEHYPRLSDHLPVTVTVQVV
ncbi:MAG: endonuclease/exonuclease/phosphatase family protein [Acidimicrobiia bacterium]